MCCDFVSVARWPVLNAGVCCQAKQMREDFPEGGLGGAGGGGAGKVDRVEGGTD